MNKEELLKENGELTSAVEQLESSDRATREQLSKILGSTKPNQYRADDDILILSWFEICSRIGSLLVKEEHSAVYKRIEALELRTHDIEEIGVNDD